MTSKPNPFEGKSTRDLEQVAEDWRNEIWSKGGVVAAALDEALRRLKYVHDENPKLATDRATVGRLLRELEARASRAAQLSRDLSASKKAHRNTERERAKLREVLERMCAFLEARDIERGDPGRMLSDFFGRYDRLADEHASAVENMGMDLEAYRDRITAMKVDYGRLEDTHDATCAQFEGVFSDLADAHDHIDNLKSDLEDATAILEAERERLAEAHDRVRELELALSRINSIRTRIVERQNVNWSADIYPLVRALEDAGFALGEGSLEKAKGRDIEQVTGPEDEVETDWFVIGSDLVGDDVELLAACREDELLSTLERLRQMAIDAGRKPPTVEVVISRVAFYGDDVSPSWLDDETTIDLIRKSVREREGQHGVRGFDGILTIEGVSAEADEVTVAEMVAALGASDQPSYYYCDECRKAVLFADRSWGDVEPTKKLCRDCAEWNPNTIYQRAADLWGADEQLLMLVEEASEAVQALMHYRRGKSDAQAVFEELADLQFTIWQAAALIDPEKGDVEVNAWLQRKAARFERKVATAETERIRSFEIVEMPTGQTFVIRALDEQQAVRLYAEASEMVLDPSDFDAVRYGTVSSVGGTWAKYYVCRLNNGNFAFHIREMEVPHAAVEEEE